MSTIELLRLPSGDELDAARKALDDGDHAVNLVEMAIAKIHERGMVESGVRVELPAEHAWRLTCFARGLRVEADQLRKWADEIDHNVDHLWWEFRDDA